MVHGDNADAGGLGGRLRQTADRLWWIPLGIGIAWFVIAWLVLRGDVTSLATVGVVVGGVFLVGALSEAVLSWVVPGGWKVLHVVLTVFYVLAAAWAFIRPINTFFALASVLGLLLFLQGAMYIARGVAARGVSPYWGLTLGSGVLTVLLGLWVSTSDRVWTLGARAAFILLWVGFLAIFRGISDISLAFELRRVGRGVQAVDDGLRERLHLPVQPTGAADDMPGPARSDASYGRRT